MRHVALPQKQLGTPLPIPAPSRGMNTLASYQALPPDKARYIENLIPSAGKCIMRPGWEESCVVSGATKIHSVLPYNGGTTITPLVACDDGKIYTVSGSTPTEVGGGYSTSDLWVCQNQNGYLLAVNGTDTPWIYNGVTLANTSFSGVTQSTLRTIRKCGERLWFAVNDSPHVWYTDPKAIAGDLTQFQLGQIAEGGYCLGVFPWRTFTVLCMSTGEILVYQGDPGTTFALYATYKAPVLVEHDAAIQIGSELILITRNGPIPMELVAAGLAFDADSLAGWAEIQPTWSLDVETYGSIPGWRGFYDSGMVYFIVPTSSAGSKIWVNNLNVPGGAWTIYTGIYATQFVRTPEGMYFGDASSGRLCKHDTTTDNGETITALCRQGFSYPTAGKFNMEFTLARVNFTATGYVAAVIQIDTDFIESDITGTEVILSTEGGGGNWDDPWDSPWGYNAKPQLRWQKILGYGRAVAPVIRLRTASAIEWYATDIWSAPASSM